MAIKFDKALGLVRDKDVNAEQLRGVEIDTTVGTPSDGKILVYRDAGSDWVLEDKPASGSTPALNDVSDVTISAVADNEILAFDSSTSTWINQTAAEAGLATSGHTHNSSDYDHDQLTNTHNLTTDIDHDALTNFVANEHIDWTADQGATNIHTGNITEGAVTQHQAAITITESQISDLDHDADKLKGVTLDATVGSPSDGKILVYRDAGSDWVLEDKPTSSGSPAMADITDVTITSAGDNEVMAYDSSSSTWINQTPAEAGLAAASHSHTASDVTDFDTEVSNNTDVAANTSARHTSGSDNQNLYSSFTDGTTTATAGSETDTFKFRSADNKLTIAVGSNDATHGDNALFTVNEANLSITESQISDLSHYDSTDFGTDFAAKTQDDLGDGTTYVRTENNFTDTLKTKLDGVEALADVTDATNVNAAGAVMNSDTSTASMSFVADEDNMASDSATKVPTQQSVKAYVDSKARVSWTEVTGTSQSASVDNGYIANNAALVTITLPDTAAVGSVVKVVGKGAGGWKVAQNASETIHFGSSDTTTGTGGYLQSTNQYDAVELVCITANTDWVVISSIGNITVN